MDLFHVSLSNLFGSGEDYHLLALRQDKGRENLRTWGFGDFWFGASGFWGLELGFCGFGLREFGVSGLGSGQDTEPRELPDAGVGAIPRQLLQRLVERSRIGSQAASSLGASV